MKDMATRAKRGIAERCLRLVQDRYDTGLRGWAVLPDRPKSSQILERLDVVEASLLSDATEHEVDGFTEEPEFDKDGGVVLGPRGKPKLRRVRTYTKVRVSKDLTPVRRLELREERARLRAKLEVVPQQSRDIVSFLTYGADYLLERFSKENLQEELSGDAVLKLLFPKTYEFPSFDYEKVLQDMGVHVDQIELVLSKYYPEEFEKPCA